MNRIILGFSVKSVFIGWALEESRTMQVYCDLYIFKEIKKELRNILVTISTLRPMKKKCFPNFMKINIFAKDFTFSCFGWNGKFLFYNVTMMACNFIPRILKFRTRKWYGYCNNKVSIWWMTWCNNRGFKDYLKCLCKNQQFLQYKFEYKNDTIRIWKFGKRG